MHFSFLIFGFFLVVNGANSEKINNFNSQTQLACPDPDIECDTEESTSCAHDDLPGSPPKDSICVPDSEGS